MKVALQAHFAHVAMHAIQTKAIPVAPVDRALQSVVCREECIDVGKAIASMPSMPPQLHFQGVDKVFH